MAKYSSFFVFLVTAQLFAMEQQASYSNILQKIIDSRSNSRKDCISLFKESPLALLTYKFAESKYYPPWQIDKSGVVDMIWSGCNYSASAALAWIAPLESYEDKLDALHSVANYGFLEQVSFEDKNIKIGLKCLITSLNLIKNSGVSVVYLCNLFFQNHVFLLHKFGDKINILQSYSGSYNLDQFLSDPLKQKSWNAEELITELQEILSIDKPIESRIKSYEKLFFGKISKNSMICLDSSFILPFIFVETKPFNAEPEVGRVD
jgi:hypothetical protein